MSKNNNNTMLGKKRSKLSVLPVIFSALLGAGALAGTGLSVWHVSKNYQESAEFKKSFNARVNVNPVAFEKTKTDEKTARENLKQAAERLSAWLKYNGAESYDVAYELTDPDSSTKSYEKSGWLSANFNISKIDPKIKTEDNPEKIDNDPYLSYFDKKGFNTNNRTIVYRWYNPNESSKDGPYYSLLNINDIFDMPTNLKAKDNNTKTLTDKDGKPGVLYKIKDNTVLNKIYKNLKQAYTDTKDDPKSNDKKTLTPFQQPRLYFINNLEGMLNEINYHLLNYYTYKDTTAYKNIYQGTEYVKYSQTVSEKNGKGDERSKPAFRLTDSVNIVDDDPYTAIVTPQELKNGEGLNFIDLSKPASVESGFLNKYVEKIYKFNDNDYQKLFPDKITDTYGNEGASTATTPNLQYAWYSTVSTHEADAILSREVDQNLKVKFVSVDVGSGEKSEDVFKLFKKSISSREVPPKFIDTIFSGSTVIGALSLGFLIFLVALLIILAVLYRTTGVMSWICMMFMLSMTGLISLIGSTTISMSLLFGLFVMSIVGFIAALAVCGRIKRRICCNEDTSVAVIKGLKKSLWPLVDISVIALLFGVCFTYIAPLNLNPLGISMIAGGFMTFLCMYLLNGLLMLLFFNNSLTMNKFIFLGRPNNRANEALAQSNSYVPTSMDATKLEISFFDRFSTTKFGLFNKWTIVVLGALGALMIAGIVVFSILGLTSGTLFHSSMCITITYNDPEIIDMVALIDSTGLKYSSVSHIGNYWYFYCDAPSDAVIQAIKALPTTHHWIDYALSFGTIVGNTNKDILNFAMISMVVAVSAISVYTGIRSNWSAFVPMLAGSVLVPVLILGLASMFKIKFDQNVVLGFALAVVANTLISNTLIASVNDSWFRKESYNKDELKFIVTASIKNSLNYILLITLGYALFILFFAICSPKGLGSLSWIMMIGAICSAVVTPVLVSTILYYFLIIRSKALIARANRLAKKVVVNMDEIDEQDIEGINKFTKPRAYAKKQTGASNE